jgi:hypothetical protein
MPWMTTPCVLVVKPRSLKPILPSVSVRTVDRVWLPSADRYKKLAPEAAETTSVRDAVAASASASPPDGVFPATVLVPPCVTTTVLVELPAAPFPLHSE